MDYESELAKHLFDSFVSRDPQIAVSTFVNPRTPLDRFKCRSLFGWVSVSLECVIAWGMA